MYEVLNEDCIEGMSRLPDESIDYVFTDPPYGIDFRPHFKEWAPIPNDGLEPEEFEAFMDRAAAEMARVLKKDSALHLCAGWSSTDIVLKVLKRHFAVKGCIVWAKNSIGLGWHLRRQHEFIFLCFKGRPPKPESAPSDVWFAKKVPGNRLLHSCQKPEELVDRALGLYTSEGDIVLDPFLGSGTTGVVALRRRRRFLGFEVEAEYARIARERIEREAEAIRQSGTLLADVSVREWVEGTRRVFAERGDPQWPGRNKAGQPGPTR